MTYAIALPGISAATYRPHALHAADRLWPQKNCYADLWIALLHAQGLDPHAMLSFAVSIDFEGDQWTFFKPPLGDLRTLYGIDVQELNVWRPLLDHALEHVAAGKLLAVEVDAWSLPDTAGIDYHEAHSKTTIVINEVDAEARRLGYFHNDGYHRLDGEDFAEIFALDGRSATLPSYAELIRVDRVCNIDGAALRDRSAPLLAAQLAWVPADDPIGRFGARFARDLLALQGAGLPAYHKWAFAGLRQLGAAAELVATYLDWLWIDHAPSLAARRFEEVAALARTLMLKSARAVATGRTLDAAELFARMGEARGTAIAETRAVLAMEATATPA